ncbi:MAG: tryptophan--tRNA ligase [Candidatus Berkelbacteria bacterium]|nr:tryptophan--tRNA ligase [Candidatus Berkelbacteria bacterium]
MRRIFSGIKPTGLLHLGNYLGAIKQWVELQNKVDESIFCVVDLHAITALRPENLSENILKIAAWYLACGIDLEKSKIFVQSMRPEHAELTWILNCFSTMGELNRMTQYKEKSEGKKDSVSVGLFDYPILMAADILLYSATDVPVGEDQKQHVELARDLAIRFNNIYAKSGSGSRDIFTIPEPIIDAGVRRIKALDNPLKKMEKSSASALNYIALDDSPDEIRKKIQRAVTDSSDEIVAREDKPAMTNLLNIFSGVSGRDIKSLELDYRGKNYGEFKKDLAEEIILFLKPKQKKFKEIFADKEKLRQILTDGSESVAPIAKEMLGKVKKAIGLGI